MDGRGEASWRCKYLDINGYERGLFFGGLGCSVIIRLVVQLEANTITFLEDIPTHVLLFSNISNSSPLLFLHVI